MKRHNISKIIGAVFITALIGLSCKKYNEWNVDESHNRLFRPSEFVAAVDGVTVTLEWAGKAGINKYLVELSKDSLQFGQIVKSYTFPAVAGADKYKLTLPDLLDPLSRYSARIKGIDSTSGIPESQWAVVSFLTTTEQIMLPVDVYNDLSGTTARFKWQKEKQVSHFMIGTTRYNITDDEKAAGEKVITGLTPKTAYTVYLHLNNSIRGSKKFSTDRVAPSGGNVIELASGADLVTAIQTATNGTVLVLPKGSKFTTDAVVAIPAGVSVTLYGIGQGTLPIVAFNGFTLPATAGTIKFENVDLTGYQNGDTLAAKRNYIFNQSTASNTAEIIFQDCIIRNFVNTPLRLQTSSVISIGKVTVDNCIVYDIGDNGSNGNYAFIHSNVANGRFNNISVTNSTFYKLGYGFILHNAGPSQSLIVENNTFYNVVGDGRYFIDYNAQVIAGTVSFKNNILAKTLSPAITARGIRSATAIAAMNSFQTNDLKFSANPITGISDYTKSSTDLFTNPAKGDFTFKDNAFEGRATAGDPRWRQ